MAASLDNLNLSPPPAIPDSHAAEEQELVLIENFILLKTAYEDLAARIAILEALHP